MARLHFLVKIVKVFSLAFNILGLLQLRFSESRKVYRHRPNCCRFVMWIFVVLILVLYFMTCFVLEQKNKLDLSIETEPLRSETELRSECYFSIWMLTILVFSWVNQNRLWNLVNEGQLAYKQLRSMLGKHLKLECSRLVFFYSIILLFLLAVFEAKSIYFDWPKLVTKGNTVSRDGLFQVLNYMMGLPRLMAVLIMALHILYHLMNAAWLQSLTELRLQRNLKFYKWQLSILYPSQKKMHFLAGSYFRVSYICFLYMVGLRFTHFLQYCIFDTNKVLHKSQDDLEYEAIWAGQDADNLTDPREPLIKSLLMLTWHVAFCMLLLASAYIKQKEYLSLMHESWNFKTYQNSSEVKAFLAENSWNGHTFNKMDILDVMFLSGISICDRQPISICFLTWQTLGKKNPTYLNLDQVAGHFRLLLNVMISSGIVYFVQQMELWALQEYLQAEA